MEHRVSRAGRRVMRAGRSWLAALAALAASCALQQPLLAQPGEPLGASAKIGAPRTAVEPPEASAAASASAADLAAPLPEPASSEPLTVYFATNRTPVPDGPRPERFADSREPFAVFGRVTVDPAADYALVPGSIELDENAGAELDAPEALAREARTAGAAADAGSADPLSAFAAAAERGDTDVILHIHGAGHDFASAVAEVARIALSYKRADAEVVPLLFSYPTNGSGTPVNYLLDRADARQSGEAMAAAFQRLVRFLAEARADGGGGRTVLMGHSLGVYTMRVGVQAVAALGPVKGVFDVAFLMAGDEDADTLSRPDKMGPLLSLAGQVSVYFAPEDVLMWVSRLGNLRKPIGLDGPRDVSTEDYGGRPVAAVNANDFAFDNDRRGHSYHWRSPRVIADGRQVFAGAEAADVTGRVVEAPRVFRIAPPALAAAASDAFGGRRETREETLAVFAPAASAPLDRADGTVALDPARPGRGTLTLLAGLSAAEAAAVREAAAALGTVEVLPGRYDAVLVAAAAATAEDFRVVVPSAAYRAAVLAAGFSATGAPQLAEGGRGRLSFALAPGTVAVAEPQPSANARDWSGTIVLSGPPEGPYDAASGHVTLTFPDGDGLPAGEAILNGRRYAITPEAGGARVSPVD